MDKNTVTGLILIFAITMAWAFYTMPSQEDIERQRLEQALQDSIASAQAPSDEGEMTQESVDRPQKGTGEITSSEERELARREPALGLFRDFFYQDTVYTTVRTNLYEAEFSNLGAGPVSFTLLKHDRWDSSPVQMIKDTSRSAYSLGFLSRENLNIETNNILFTPLNSRSQITVQEGGTQQLEYIFSMENGTQIKFTYTFFDDSYSYNLDIETSGLLDLVSGVNVDFSWKPPLNFTERDRSQDALSSAGYVYAGGEMEKFQLESAGRNEQRINGTIDWVGSRTKFFAQFIKPVSPSNAAILIGEVTGEPGEPGSVQTYETAIQSSLSSHPNLSYQLYIGPLQYNDLKDFDEHAYDVVEIGYALIRWFADPLVRFLIIPFFSLGSMFISNYGILIILFGVIVKLVLFPLTQKSFKSMAAMKELQPQMKELQEKYKDDPQKQQKETIALYRKAKVNPLGGCLPMLLQFPILITLFFFFQNSMLIRQQSFLWANDLSAPDYILSLPFSIPMLGSEIGGFVLLMSAAMVIQMKVSGGGMSGGAAPSGAPNMKAFMYIMPFFMLFIFNNFASGLSLYYLVYNVLSAAQQFVINKSINTPEPDKNTGKKGKRKSRKKKAK